MYTTMYHSPIGLLNIVADKEAITSLLFVNNDPTDISMSLEENYADNSNKLLEKCITQLQEFFNGSRREFDLPIKQTGTEFQQKVWYELTQIGYGKTISYQELSKRIGNIKAIRAVGSTNGNNKISIVVPCHRVIGSNGDLTGFAGGLWRKKWLLDHENTFANGLQTLF